jgi:hypothetical protein
MLAGPSYLLHRSAPKRRSWIAIGHDLAESVRNRVLAIRVQRRPRFPGSYLRHRPIGDLYQHVFAGGRCRLFRFIEFSASQNLSHTSLISTEPTRSGPSIAITFRASDSVPPLTLFLSPLFSDSIDGRNSRSNPRDIRRCDRHRHCSLDSRAHRTRLLPTGNAFGDAVIRARRCCERN